MQSTFLFKHLLFIESKSAGFSWNCQSLLLAVYLLTLPLTTFANSEEPSHLIEVELDSGQRETGAEIDLDLDRDDLTAKEKDPRPEDYMHRWNPYTISEGYLLGRMIHHQLNNVLGVYFLTTFSAEIFLGDFSSKGGVADYHCVKKKLKRYEKLAKRVSKKQLEFMPALNSDEGRRNAAEVACKERNNPWTVAARKVSWEDVALGHDEGLQLVRYKQYINVPLVNAPLGPVPSYIKSNTIIHSIEKADAQLALPETVDTYNEIVPWNFAYRSRGAYEGLVVQAGLDGFLLDGFQAIVLTNESPDDFQRVAVPSAKLFYHIIRCMATSRQVRVHYYEFRSWLAAPGNFIHRYKTNRRAYRVDLLPKRETLAH